MHTWMRLSLIELATVIMVLYDKFIATGLKFTFDEKPFIYTTATFSKQNDNVTSNNASIWNIIL